MICQYFSTNLYPEIIQKCKLQLDFLWMGISNPENIDELIWNLYNNQLNQIYIIIKHRMELYWKTSWSA